MLLAVVSALTPAPANASSIAQGQYWAAPGEVNDVSVAYDAGSDTISFADTGAVIEDGALFDLCSVSVNVATCDGSITPFLRLGDGDDRATLLTAMRGPSNFAVFFGEEGSDRLDAGPGDPGPRFGGIQFWGGAGDDTLIGGKGGDTLNGDEGDDLVLGREGNDVIDGSAGSPLPYQASGSDTLDGGPGSDILNGVEARDGPQSADSILCGGGVEPSFVFGSPYPPRPGDEAVTGSGDTITTDCEFVGEGFICPQGGDACSGRGVVDGLTASSGASAVSAAGGGRRYRLGADRFSVKPGGIGIAHVRLKGRRLKQLLRGKRGAAALSAIRARAGGGTVLRKNRSFRLAQR